MMLRRRVVLASLAAALPAAVVLGYAADRLRMADLEVALERVVRSQLNDQVRERCESDPTWFLTGTLEGRPKGGVFIETRPDDLPPRPKVVPQPFELFAYDEQFIGSSSASARFPAEFRQALRTGVPQVNAPHVTAQGTGVQLAVPTGWIGSTCSFFLGRMDPPPNQRRQRWLTYASLFGAAFLVGLLAAGETVTRVRRLARQVREAVDAGYVTIGPDRQQDELSSLTFVYNDAVKALQERKARIDDQDAALRRFVQSTEEDVSRPLAALETTLGAAASGVGPARLELHDALKQAHDLSSRVENLTAAAHLRLIGQDPPTTTLDLNAIVTAVIARHMPIADTAAVALHLSLPPTTITIAGDEKLVERAIANVVDNAIRYNRPGGEVRVTLAAAEDHTRFRLCVTDTGDGVSDETFRGLTAVRRFRGDEGRNRRPGAPGLGLAVAREVADRFKLRLDLKRPAAGGFEVELSGAA
jgi:signal transduction histidine kinase